MGKVERVQFWSTPKGMALIFLDKEKEKRDRPLEGGRGGIYYWCGNSGRKLLSKGSGTPARIHA